MTAIFIVMAAFVVVSAAAAFIVYRCFPHQQITVPVWTVTGLVGLMVGVAIGGEFADTIDRNDSELLDPPYVEPLAVRLRHPLMCGDKIKAFKSEGWVNGTPPEIGNAKLYVLDIWADWCPVCRDAAPVLVESYQKYQPRGVQFVSISVMPETVVRPFVADYQVKWPTGYAATVETILEYGALDPSSSQNMNPMVHLPEDAYVVPTIYLLREDGTVLWTDQNSRYMHKSLEEIAGNLDAAIEAALAEITANRVAAKTQP